MKELTMSSERILGAVEKTGDGVQGKGRLESVSWLKSLLHEVKASFAAPFNSDPEKKSGLHLYWSMGPL